MKKSANNASAFVEAVAEMQGLEGPFSFPEKLLQKIWLRGDFDATRAVTTDGRVVRVLHPGRWNLLGGPDFKDARLRLGDMEVTGDVEVHLHAGDWVAHAHAADEAYDGVVLHVVLFPATLRSGGTRPASEGNFSRGRGGRQIPVLALLPLLHHDLEEFAADEVVETFANRPASRAIEELSPLAPAELEALLRRHAEMRWRQKIRFARVRLDRLGWQEACHQAALEILGYRFNRAPMLRIAAVWPLSAWEERGQGAAEEALAAERERWSVQGVRPANHPRVRLRQYAAWTRARPDWPSRLEAFARALPGSGPARADASTTEFRRALGLTKFRERLAAEICDGAVGGTRFDNLVCDGFWPLLAAGGPDEGAFFARWFHWPTGDLPPHVMQTLRALGVFTGRGRPACHGFAQGLLGWLLARESSAGQNGCRT